ncbi:AAA family ATPase [Patescibacteria group bacterium]|nr:AAA family ATPase [Patescibacteria group bacterium]
MTKLIILRGYPGSGKTTLGKALESAGAGKLVDHNQILGDIAKITGNDDGIYEEIHALEQAVAKKIMTDGQTVIVARGFSSVDSIQPYIKIAEELHMPYSIFRLDVPTEILKQRVSSPERQNGWNPTTTPEALEVWAAGHPMKSIDGEIILDSTKPIDALVKEVNSHNE